MEVLDRALLKHVAGAGGSAPIQKPISTTRDASGTQIQKFDLGDGVSAFVVCSSVTGNVSFGISGRKVIQLDVQGGGSYESCKLTTVKDGHILESKKVSEADLENDDVEIAASGDISDFGDGGSGDFGGDGGSTGESGGYDGGGGDSGGGGGDDRTPNEQE